MITNLQDGRHRGDSGIPVVRCGVSLALSRVILPGVLWGPLTLAGAEGRGGSALSPICVYQVSLPCSLSVAIKLVFAMASTLWCLVHYSIRVPLKLLTICQTVHDLV